MVKYVHSFYIFDMCDCFWRPLHTGREVITSPEYRWDASCRNTKSSYGIFQYTISGRGIFRYKGKIHEVKAETAFLCDATDHNYVYEYPAGETEPWEVVWFAFGGANTSDVIQEFIQNYGVVFRISPEHGFIRRLLEFESSPERLVEMDALDGLSLISSLLTSLAHLRKHDIAQTLQSNPLMERLSRMLDSGNIFNIGDMALQLGCSREHLSRQFRRATGKCLVEIIAENRCSMICRQLLEANRSLEKIAKDTGFSSVSNLIASFRRQTGKTPGQFRQEHRSLMQ